MGTRLYPKFRDGVTSNQVINLTNPELNITDEDYQRWKILYDKYEKSEITADEYYEIIYADGNDNLSILSTFETFGWGKFKGLPFMYENGNESYSGSLKLTQENAHDFDMLFGNNDINPKVMSLITGVYWV